MGRAGNVRALIWQWVPVVAWMVVIFICSSFSRLPDPGGFQISDKVKHFAAYAVLGLVAYRAFRGSMRSWGAAAWSAAAVALAAFYGASDEFHQYFIPGRHCDFFDWLADFSGAAAVTLIVIGFNYLRRRGEVGGRQGI